jgi:uncharacterized membrane protein YeaQ/YmgE (transglycosylase-associated protein family)
MTFEAVAVWVLVGLVAGVLASFVIDSSYGLLGDILVGILGAVIGGWIAHAADLSVPLGGIAGRILVAFGGAVVLLLAIRLIQRATRRRTL